MTISVKFKCSSFAFLFTIFWLLPHTVHASDCGTYTAFSTCNEHLDYCKWESGQCVEKCPTNSNTGSCENYDGCYTDAEFGGCSPCGPGTYNNTNGATSCISCSSFSYSTGQIFDATYDNTYGLNTCPWICDTGYYRGGTSDDTCYSCPEHANNCTTTGLTYSDVHCGDGYTASTTTTHTVSCQSCSDANATNNNGICYCKTGYYSNGTPTGLNTLCTACPAGTTSNAGATSKTSCHMTSNTQFCDANGENCMNLIPSGATNIQ